MLLFIFFLVGAAMTIGPWFTDVLGSGSKIGLSLAGLLVLFVVMIWAVITKLYRKASANMAFVRTGVGGAEVAMDYGKIVVPVMHQVIPVSLETMRLNVERRGVH